VETTTTRTGRLRPLTMGLMLAFGSSASGFTATALAATVGNCNDDGSPGSLRSTIAAAISGDTIDIPAALGCSTITLATGSGAIPIGVSDLAIDGHGAVTIDGGEYSVVPREGSILYHFGFGTLRVYGVTMQNAVYRGSAHANGGCIYSRGNVTLQYSTLQNCSVEPASAATAVRGGAVSAQGEVTLKYSNVSGNRIVPASDSPGAGGGIYSGIGFYSAYSTISDNLAGGKTFGGGVFTPGHGNVTVRGTTISGNHAYSMGGLSVYATPNSAPTTTISNSTISGNTADFLVAGALTTQNAYVYNSTFAFNVATIANVAGLYAAAELELQSSILANNFGATGEDDMFAFDATGTNNIVVATPVTPPAGTSSACPRLAPLADNGGLTQTHALAKNSPAIDNGNNVAQLQFDQRGNGFAREAPTGKPDIGAFERHASDSNDFVFGGQFEGRCD
jgi:hypothetical protein